MACDTKQVTSTHSMRAAQRSTACAPTQSQSLPHAARDVLACLAGDPGAARRGPAGRAPVAGPGASATATPAVLKCVCENEAATERRMRSISRNVSSLPCATCAAQPHRRGAAGARAAGAGAWAPSPADTRRGPHTLARRRTWRHSDAPVGTWPTVAGTRGPGPRLEVVPVGPELRIDARVGERGRVHQNRARAVHLAQPPLQRRIPAPHAGAGVHTSERPTPTPVMRSG